MIIDTRSEEMFKKDAIPTALNLPQTDVFDKHTPKSLLEIKTAMHFRSIDLEAFEKAGFIILYGNGSSAVVKTVIEHNFHIRS